VTGTSYDYLIEMVNILVGRKIKKSSTIDTASLKKRTENLNIKRN
jgi:hypothetical protein